MAPDKSVVTRPKGVGVDIIHASTFDEGASPIVCTFTELALFTVSEPDESSGTAVLEPSKAVAANAKSLDCTTMELSRRIV